jgi:tetratricopeptide (TPR) repeat protein
VRKAIIGIALFCAMATAASAVSAREELARGIEAFKGADYQQALKLFQRAQKDGNDSARLRYNIGVTLMKLGLYREASAQFQRLLRDPEWEGLARYNLALAAEKRDQPVLATKHYRRIGETSSSPKLRRLAASRLNALAAGSQRPAVKPWLGTASLAAGRDGNAYALEKELMEDSSVGADNYLELFAWGQYQLRGTDADGWRIHGYGYSRRYSEFDSLNLHSVSAALSRDNRWRDWDTEVGAAGETVYLGGELLSTQVQLLGRIRRDFGETRITLAYIPSYYLGGEDYDYLDGWRQRIEVAVRRPLFAGEIHAFYRFDASDRAGLVKDNADYYSYSPARHAIGGALDWSLRNDWEVSTGVEYRLSEYGGSNRVTDSDGQVSHYQRESDRIKSWLSTKFKVTPRFSLDGKIVVIDNQENQDIYSFEKTEASLGVSYIF